MERPFLLMAGYDYYPGSGTKDWIKCFSTYDEALGHVDIKERDGEKKTDIV